MSYIGLILKNPFRNKTRTSLAIVGIAIGIATIVALGLVTGGLKASTENTLKSGGSDLTVSEANANFMSGVINEARVNEIKDINGVKDTAGVLRKNALIGNESLTVSGIQSNKLNFVDIQNVEGKTFTNSSENEIILGKTAAENLDKKVGDKITLFDQEFTIVGIYETGNMMQDVGAFVSLSNLQNLTNSEDEVSSIYVKINDNANLTEVSKTIEKTYPNELSTTSAAAMAQRMNDALGVIDSATWAISLLAIFIGGVGVINTMIMSVFERTREIGVLKAVGWRNRRILGMILGESIVITLIAAIVGTVVGIVAVEIGLRLISAMGNIITPVYSLDVFLTAFTVAIIVGLLGGIYPAYRASKLAPTEALRYE